MIFIDWIEITTRVALKKNRALTCANKCKGNFDDGTLTYVA